MDVILVRTPKGSPLTGDPAPSKMFFLDYYEDLALSYLSACLMAANYECKVIDTEWMRLDEKSLAEICLKEECNVFAFSVHAYDFLKVTLRTILKIKVTRPNAKIILGGHPLTDLDVQIMENFKFIDFILRGEGEESLIQLITAIYKSNKYDNILGLTYRKRKQIIRNDDAPRITKLDDIPEPYRYMWESNLPKPYYALVCASRGCYGECSMCSVRAFYGKQGHRWIGRSPQSVVEEISNLNKKYGIKIFSIIDPNFMGCGNLGRQRAIEFANIIIRNQLDIKFDIACRVNDIDIDTFRILKQAGLYKVFLGAESGNQKVLEQLNKGTTVEQNLKAFMVMNELELLVETGFIMIMPDTTLDDIVTNLEFIKQIKKFQPYRLGSRLFTHPNFDISKKLEEENIVYGNLLEKRYKIKDEEVSKYYDTWSILYETLALFLGKSNKLLIHSLWNQEVLNYISKLNEEILLFFIELLEDSIKKIRNNQYDNQYVSLLKDKFKDFVNHEKNELDTFCKNIKNSLRQYEWIGRSVEL